MTRLGACWLTAAAAAGMGMPAATAADSKPLPARPPAYAPLPPDALADALRAEQAAYSRRLDVCTRLREIAVRTNDDKLYDRSLALEQQADALYHGRTARLGVKPGLRATSAPAGVRSPADVLDQKLGGDGDPLADLTPRPAADPARPATAQARQFREVQP